MSTSLFFKIIKYIYVIIITTSINFSPQVLGQERSCNEKEKVCEWLKKVVAIKTPTMIASGIFLSDSIIVTNRHVVEDSKAVLVRMPNKKIIKAFTNPNNHTADIAFISLTKNIQSIKSPRITSIIKLPCCCQANSITGCPAINLIISRRCNIGLTLSSRRAKCIH